MNYRKKNYRKDKIEAILNYNHKVDLKEAELKENKNNIEEIKIEEPPLI